MKTQRRLDVLHPLMLKCVSRIQKEILDTHNVPIRLFETGRDNERHKFLVAKGKTKDIYSKHLYKLEHNPPLYATAVDYVFFENKWSWNLRDSTVNSWYVLFGNLVLDLCPELQWFGMNRKAVNLCHFELKQEALIANLDKIPCVI